MKEIIDIIHKTIYQFFDACEDGEEPLSDKDKLLLKVNKAICNNLKALDQEPCEDAVSRQAIQEIIDSPYTYCSQKLDAIIKLPLVTPIRLKGHWIMTNDYLTTAYGSVDYVKCSCCGEDSLEEGNFCPNCGADMREGE